MGENNKILSISVAAYNIEKFIEQNLESFIKSEARDKIEVLVIDDESKDNTVNIVEKYQKSYPNVIKLIKQKNAGPGATVNTGIKYANGKYFRMVDGDDWVNSDNLTKLIEVLEQQDVDMVLTDYEIYDDILKKITKVQKVNIESNKILNFDEICEKLNIGMHNAIYKTSIFKENNIKLDNGFYTDNEYLMFPIAYVNNLIYIDISVYIYRIGREGQSVSLDVAKLERNKEMAKIVRQSLVKHYKKNIEIMTESKRKFFIKFIASRYSGRLDIFLTYDNKELRKKEIKELIEEAKKTDLEIYKEFKKGKKEKLIIYSNFLLLGIIAKISMKRNTKKKK